MRKLLVLAIVLLCACTERELVVESNTTWSGSISGEDGNGSSVDGSGNRKFELPDGKACWSFQKETPEGSLRVYARTKEIVGPRRHDAKYGDDLTTTAFGVVSGCREG